MIVTNRGSCNESFQERDRAKIYPSVERIFCFDITCSGFRKLHIKQFCLWWAYRNPSSVQPSNDLVSNKLIRLDKDNLSKVT